MVSLKLLLTVDIRLSQGKGKINNDNTVLDGLAPVIIMGNFYQFSLVVERSLWTHPISGKKIYDKSIWNQFMSVITLTKQMRQYDNKLFQAIVTKARKSLLNNDNIAILNGKVAVTIPILNPNE